MVAPDLMRAAVTADYTSECLKFLRSNFDVQDPDPAAFQPLVVQFAKHMRALFVEGLILSQVPAAEQGSDVRTACQMVFEEIQSEEPNL